MTFIRLLDENAAYGAGVNFTCELVSARAVLADIIYTKTFKLPESTFLAQHIRHITLLV